MRDLISSLEEAAGPERLTRMPHTCPHGWEQVKVKKGRQTFFTCKPPSTMDLARQGASPLVLSWEAVKKYDLERAEKAIGLGRYTAAQNKIRHEIMTHLDQEQDEDLKQGKKWLIKTLKPLFKKLGVDVGPARRRHKRSR